PERSDRGPQSVDARELARWIDVLPREQESHEIGRAHWFDLRAEPIERVAMNARKETAIAPLERRRPSKSASQNRAFRFEREERGGPVRLSDRTRSPAR